ncbi:helix-turn-helix transcriptional regulator [Cupriavidus sp. CV2]|uniref:helix-turn-helix transcriptional regulator n=1 Tax=Cupriavidus ulmosensis TaxID=3065913 RepID=UPI00296AA34C|nr:helix-turn-helix transcriptional regulator [Cupriavidus sp. CV2]MDW3687863.1 helix-turn-helix transcriptional regulator [Cupriavidus sp. CV2]
MDMTAKEQAFNETVIALYEGVTDPGGFNAALHRMTQLTGSAHSVFILWPHGAIGGSIENNSGDPGQLVDLYNSSYNALDPARDVVPFLPEGAWFYDRRELSPETLRQSPFHQDFLYREGIGSLVAMRAVTDHQTMAFFGQQKYLDRPLYEERDLKMLEKLSPHLRRVTRLRLELAVLRMRQGWLESAFSQLKASMILCDGSGRILFTNRAAEAMLKDSMQALTIRAGHLSAWRNPNIVAAALGRAAGLFAPGVGAALSLQAARGKQIAWVVPVPPSSSLAAPWQRPVALVWVKQPEPDEGDGPDFELLKAVYGLTQAECRIAELILQDLSPQECAQALGVTLATVRTQVRSLHAKCGCRRQTSLVRILEQFRKPV